MGIVTFLLHQISTLIWITAPKSRQPMQSSVYIPRRWENVPPKTLRNQEGHRTKRCFPRHNQRAIARKKKTHKCPCIKGLRVFKRVVPVAGLEPARHRWQWILSPPRLPIPTHRRLCFSNRFPVSLPRNRRDIEEGHEKSSTY